MVNRVLFFTCFVVVSFFDFMRFAWLLANACLVTFSYLFLNLLVRSTKKARASEANLGFVGFVFDPLLMLL